MKHLMITVGFVCFVVWGSWTAAAENAASAQQVEIGNFSFVPATITVKAGTTVTWVNKDDVPHTVVATANGFSSRVLDTDGTYTHTFTAPGSFEYYCSVHPHMKGRVIVQPLN